MIRTAIIGAAGRMGCRLSALCLETPGLTLAGAVDAPGHARLGQDIGPLAGVAECGVKLTERIPAGVQVAIDFTMPAATRMTIKACVEQGVALVIGTTGLNNDDQKLIDQAAQRIAILQAPNMSLGVNLLFALAAQVAKRLGDDYDIEIVEAHHRHKKDAPSGTAIGIAQAICAATGKDYQKDVVHGREGDGERKRGEIGMHALRMGDVVGDHTAHFAAQGERLELRHVASTRDVFARGALRAAAFLADKPAGRYRMADVLGL